MIYLIKSHATGNLIVTNNLSVSNPIVENAMENAIRFVKELRIVEELQKEPIREYE